VGQDAAGRAPDAHGEHQAVHLECGRADDFRQPPCGGSPPEVHLQEAVLGRDKALGEEEVVFVLGKDVGDVVVVAVDADFGLESGENDFAGGLGKGARDYPVAPDAQGEESYTDDNQNDENNLESSGHGLPRIVSDPCDF